MFVPLHDINPLRRIRAPVVTYTLIAACTVIFVLFQSVDAEYAALGFGVIPAEFRLGALPTIAAIPEPLTFITYTFVHGGWMHLIGNMLFLWVFGDNVEDAMGHGRFLGFYMVAGSAGALAHAASAPYSGVPLVGASGAIAGVVAAYVILHPCVKVWVLLLARLPLKISAMWAIAGWVVFQIGGVLLDTERDTAWWAHIGGFAAGALLIPVMRRPGVPLFDRPAVETILRREP